MEQVGFVPLTIKEKELFRQFLEKTDFPLSSYFHFSSLIAWMDGTKVEYKVVGEYLCFLCRDISGGGWYGLPPLGPYDTESCGALHAAVTALYEEVSRRKEKTFQIGQVKKWMLPYFRQLHTFDFRISYDRGESDYIYEMSEFCKALEKPEKRYDIRHFIKYYEPKVKEFAPENRDDCFRLLEEVWCKSHDCTECREGSLKKALGLFLRYQEQLGLKGFLVYSKEWTVGYIGVAASKTEVIFQIKKNSYGIRGLSEFMHKEAILRYCKGFDTVNYTEDMGRPGLRQYKERIAPYTLSHNYVLESSV